MPGGLNNNNNNNDRYYGAAIMAKSYCKSSPGSSDQCRLSAGGHQPSDQANRLGLRVRRQLAATIYINHHHLLQEALLRQRNRATRLSVEILQLQNITFEN